MAGEPKRTVKVAKFRILKPVDGITWNELGELLREARYRVFRLGNLAVSEAYLNFHLFRTGQTEKFERRTIGKLSRELRAMLLDEGRSEEKLDRFSAGKALPSTIDDALSQYKLRAITNPNKWRKVVRGEVSLPTFRLGMAIPVRCDKIHQRRVERTDSGELELDLMICRKPYPRVMLRTPDDKRESSQRAILERLLDNTDQSMEGYRHRLYEIKQERFTKRWYLYVTYDFSGQEGSKPNPDIAVGVDLGVSVPLYVALNTGLARLGRRHFQSVGARIRALRNQLDARRRSIQRGGRVDLTHDTGRSGHGRKRKLLPVEKLQGRVDRAYTTLNHQMSVAVIEFAKDHGAGVVQIEDLSGLKDQLRGTFIGSRWRYHQLQQFLEYKGKESGIEVRKVNPAYTSRRCSKCGYIHKEFDRGYRDSHRSEGKVTRFVCPKCNYEADPDYNAARNRVGCVVNCGDVDGTRDSRAI